MVGILVAYFTLVAAHLLGVRQPARTDPPPAAASAVGGRVAPTLVKIETYPRLGRGSCATGMVLSSTGLVVTNYHSLAGASEIRATDLGDGRSYPTAVLGTDQIADIAVLRLDGASGLARAELGDSDTVRAGSRTVSVGNGLCDGGEPSVVAGPVLDPDATVARRIDDDGLTSRMPAMITTDALTLPGDSGGALVDGDGRVIAMNETSDDGPPGHSSAVPVDRVMEVARRLVADTPAQDELPPR